MKKSVKLCATIVQEKSSRTCSLERRSFLARCTYLILVKMISLLVTNLTSIRKVKAYVADVISQFPTTIKVWISWITRYCAHTLQFPNGFLAKVVMKDKFDNDQISG